MKRPTVALLVVAIPLLLLLTVWQSGRFATISAESRRLENSQHEWVDANKKIIGSIAVLSSRERADRLALSMGLEKASPDRRLIVEAKRPATQSKSSAAQAAAHSSALKGGDKKASGAKKAGIDG